MPLIGESPGSGYAAVEAGVADGLEHGGSQPALRVVVLDGQERVARGVRGRQERVAVHGFDAVEVGDDGEAVAWALAHDLEACDREGFVGAVDRRCGHPRGPEVDEAAMVGGKLHAGVRRERVGRIEDDGLRNRPEECQVLEPHLRGPVLTDADAGVRAAELDVVREMPAIRI